MWSLIILVLDHYLCFNFTILTVLVLAKSEIAKRACVSDFSLIFDCKITTSSVFIKVVLVVRVGMYRPLSNVYFQYLYHISQIPNL